MKKIIVLLAIVVGALNLNAQRAWVWYDSINSATIVGPDTVLQPKNKDNLIGGGVGSLSGNLTIETDLLNANDAYIHCGSSEMLLSTSDKYYDFLSKDSIQLDMTTMDHTVRNAGITELNYSKAWEFDQWNFTTPMLRIVPHSVSTGWIRWKWVFFKQ